MKFDGIANELYNALNNNKSFHITAKRKGKVTFDVVMPATKLYDLTNENVTFFDVKKGLSVDIWFGNAEFADNILSHINIYGTEVWRVEICEESDMIINMWNEDDYSYDGCMFIEGY